MSIDRPRRALSIAATVMALLAGLGLVRAAGAEPGAPAAAAGPVVKAPFSQAARISVAPVQVREIEKGLKLPIDLPTALALTGKQNLDVLEARARVAEAAARRDEAIGKLFPSAYSSGLFFGQRTSGQTQGLFTILGRSFDRANAAGGVELSLNAPQALFAALAAHRGALAAGSDSREVTQEALAAVAGGYFVLLQARAEIQIAEQALAASRELERVTQSREALGAALKADVLRAAAQVGADRVRLARAGERMRNASVALALLIRLDPKVTLVPIEATIRQSVLVDPKRGLDELLRQAIASRPALRAQGERVEAAGENRSAAWAGALAPSLYANFQANSVGDTGSHQFSVGSVGLRLSIASFGAARAVAAQLVEEQIRRERLSQQIEEEVIVSRDRVQTAAEEVSAALEGLKAAEQALELSQARFEAGRGIELEVLDSNAALTEARSNLVAALTGYDIAQVQLLKAVGGVSAEALIK